MSDLFQDELDRFERTQDLMLMLVAREHKALNELEAEKDRIQAERALADRLAEAAKDYYDWGDHGSRRRLKDILVEYDNAAEERHE